MSENHESWRELCRSRASRLLIQNQTKQDSYVNRKRRTPRSYNINDLVFVIKYSQSKGKLDPGIRGPYRVIQVLPNGRYQLKLLSGSYGKTTQAAAEYMIPWNGEWCPESCAVFFENDELTDRMESSLMSPQPSANIGGCSGDPSAVVQASLPTDNQNRVEDDASSG
nr:uncharacterized protein LOC116772711 [Danaus plexippus plexippus]